MVKLIASIVLLSLVPGTLAAQKQPASKRVRANSKFTHAKKLSAADRAAIRALDERFVQGWLKDDVAQVLSVFAPDAILLPPGSGPVQGTEAIRKYWWPDDGSTTVITSFVRRIDEIDGTTQLAFMRGTAALSWTYEKNGQKSSQTSKAIDLLVLARASDGQWRVVRQMWNSLPK